jgi:hypothetical protein
MPATRPSPGEVLEQMLDLGGGAVVVLMPFMLLAIPGVILFVVLPLIVLAAPAVVVGLLLSPVLLARRLLRRR